jgi:hypothetical protein
MALMERLVWGEGGIERASSVYSRWIKGNDPFYVFRVQLSHS